VVPMTGFDRALVYRIPENLKGLLQPGSLVRIPLMNRSAFGLVEKMGSEEEVASSKIKYIFSLEHSFPVTTPDALRLARWMSVYYAAGWESVTEVLVPRALRAGMKAKEKRFLKIQSNLSEDELAKLKRRAPKQAKLYEFIAAQAIQSTVDRAFVLKRLKVGPASADGLVEKGILADVKEEEGREVYRDAWGEGEAHDAMEHDLNPEQASASEAVGESLNSGMFHCHLLHGITGSGKTEVYLHAVKEALQADRGVVFLVPEVALTPQTVGRLRGRLEKVAEEEVVVWHSALSQGERFDAWRKLAEGRARVVVGARSAIFAPIENLGLVVVDEEHEPAYKQEETPRYHGRDVAVYRASLNKAVCILGSATPSLESLHNVEIGKYDANYLRKRVDDRKLPTIHVVDMKRETIKSKGIAVFSEMLKDKLRDRFEKGEQSILFINRRGFDASLHCPDCGFVAVCDHCDITLTHHKADKILRCHLCGFEDYVPSVCPKCRSPKIHYRGSGTQKAEAFAKELLPEAKIVRIDADTMQKKHRFRELLGDFRKGKIDILVGTQMIAKGLDFPNVTLVGLLDADLSMHLPDFRASERTFQLVMQVSGRAGRGDRAGEVIVQTYLPHASPIQFARHEDFDGFALEELEHRKAYGYPPYRHLVHHLLRSRNREKLEFYAKQFAHRAEEVLREVEPNLEIRGPAPCPLERIQDYFRYQIWYFVPNVSRFIPHLTELRKSFKWDKEVIEVVDVDAMYLS